jgi:cyclic pyranopterin phosphate synthase
MNDQLSHIDDNGRASMVDVSAKPLMNRTAVATGFFVAKKETLDAVIDGNLPKGEALPVARIAGIQAAKNCSSLIPLCHPLPLECVSVAFERVTDQRLQITATAKITAKTGIEMEALTAVSIAALTLWDMTKAIDNTLLIEGIMLVKKVKVIQS